MSEKTGDLTPRQAYARAYYEANKASEKEKMRAWREANKEKQRAWREANKQYEAGKQRAWREANPEYFLEYSRAWHLANPEKVRNAKAKRMAAPGVITPGWIPKLLELQRWTCAVCNVDLRFGYHLDHIYPIARGGLNTDYNLQALCPTCNLQKNDKDPIDFMQSRGFLL